VEHGWRCTLRIGLAATLGLTTAACEEEPPVEVEVAITEAAVALEPTTPDPTLTIDFTLAVKLSETADMRDGIVIHRMDLKTADGSVTLLDGFHQVKRLMTKEIVVDPGETYATPYSYQLYSSGKRLCEEAPIIITVGHDGGEVQSEPIIPAGC
jgi:hypothetical protein